MPMTPQEMIKLLKKNGFEVVSQNGSHIKLKQLSFLITPGILKRAWNKQFLNRRG